MAIGSTKGILRGRKRKGEMLKLRHSQDFGSVRSTDSSEKGMWHGWMLCRAGQLPQIRPMGTKAENIPKLIFFFLWREIRVNMNHSSKSLRSILFQEEICNFFFFFLQ